jgi:hypothetical protein
LAHRRLWHEERAGDLGRRQAADRAQRQCDLGLRSERRVAAGEDQAESFVGHGLVTGFLALQLCEALEQLRLARERAFPADAIDRAVARGRDQPGARILRRSVARPALECGRDRVLKGVLCELEVAEDADQGCENAAPLLAEDGFDRNQCSTTGLTSIVPPVRAAGILAATSIASSRFSASIR